MNDDTRREPEIAALDELGRRFERVILRPTPWRRIVLAPWRRIVVAALVALTVLTAATPGGRAMAERVAEWVGLAEEKAALREYCNGPRPCTIVDNLGADTEAQLRLVRPGQALAVEGRPVSDCPEAAAAYRRLGVEVDAFLGPCPELSESPRAPNETGQRNLDRALEDRVAGGD